MKVGRVLHLRPQRCNTKAPMLDELEVMYSRTQKSPTQAMPRATTAPVPAKPHNGGLRSAGLASSAGLGDMRVRLLKVRARSLVRRD